MKKNNKKFQDAKDCANSKNGRSDKSTNKSNKGRSNSNNNGKRNGRDNPAKSNNTPSFDNGHFSNDISWYIKSAELLTSVGNFNFANPIGTALPLTHYDQDGLTRTNELNVSGVMSVNVTKAPGIATRASDPLNVAARALYTFVRHQNSGAKNYESADLMMYVLAMDEAYSFYAYLMRVYSTCLLYSQRNKYLPRALFHANGIDPSIADSMPELRTYINLYAQKLSTMCIPNNIDLIKRHVWLFSNYWLDSPEIKSQILAYVPSEFKYYSGYTDRQGGELISTPWHTGSETLKDLSDIKEMGDRIIYSIIEDEDMAIISGDILKAYGDGNLYSAPMVPSDSVVLPTFNPEVLIQMHHATIVPATISIQQENGIISATATADIAGENRVALHDIVLNMPVTGVTPADCVIATRLVTHINDDFQISSCGSEIVNAVNVYTILGSGSIIHNTLESNILLAEREGDGPDFPATIPMLDVYLRLAKYDYFPLLYTFVAYMGSSGAVYEFLDVWNDLQNYTVIPVDRVDLLHLVSLQGLFNIPDVAIRG